MKQPPVRELLASYLLKRQENILQRLVAQVAESPDMAEVNELVDNREYEQAIGTLLKLLVHNIADPNDRRCFFYARQRAQERFRQDITASQMLRLAGLHRQVLCKMVQRQFNEEPALVRRMTEIIDAQVSELEMTFSDAYQSARDRQWEVSETKYFSLFENASEAIISFRPGEGRIIEVNVQAERLVGQSRARLLGMYFVDIFPEEHQQQVRWLIEQPTGTSNLRLEDMSMLRADGLAVPISLSCNWINVDGHAVAQVIVRDVTQLRQMQRELQNYAEQLEARVAERTREWRESEERFRHLFLQERRRARHLALINDAQTCALTTDDNETFLHRVVAAIQSYYTDCDVTFFLRAGLRDDYLPDSSRYREPHERKPYLPEEDSHALLAIAQAGGHGLAVPIGSLHPADLGLPGQVAQSGETRYAESNAHGEGPLSGEGPHSGEDAIPGEGDAPRVGDPDDEGPTPETAPGVHRDTRSEMAVPVATDGGVIGVIAVQSEAEHSFEGDVTALQSVAAIIASHLHSSRLYREMSDLSDFNQTLITTMLHSLMVVDGEGRIRIVNERFCQTLGVRAENLANQPLTAALGETVVERYFLADILRDVTETGTPHELLEVQVWSGDNALAFDLRMSRVFFRGEPQVVVLLINVTNRWRKAHQRQMLNEMGRLFQASLDINRVLYTVLTCITAGSALGFNRAFLLLREEGSTYLKGAMALGPSSSDEASRIWRELSQQDLSLQEILSKVETYDAAHPSPLQQRSTELSLDLQNPAFTTLANAVRDRRALRVYRGELAGPHSGHMSPQHQAERQAALELFTAPEVVIAPLVAKERIVGIVLADNLYSGSPIETDDVQMLETLAQQAGLTIDNALTYQALQKAQKDLISAERLVVIGEMAARVSHEIRNPLATVGGIARSVLRFAEHPDVVRKKTEVIVEELDRLEELLSDLLDMARPRKLDLQTHSLNEIIDHALLLAGADIKAANVTVEKNLQPDVPPVQVDRRRLLQALLNTLRNGAQAMPQGGTLVISTRLVLDRENEPRAFEIEVRDSGSGISEHAVEQIFDPFFSTKIRGSGLGLAVTRRIVQDHGGDIEVQSEEGKGTAFILRLPLRRDNPSLACPADAPPGQADVAIAQDMITPSMTR